MTKREFKKLIGYSNIIELEYGVAKIALEKGWVTPFDKDLICHRKWSKRYCINQKIFPFKVRDIQLTASFNINTADRLALEGHDLLDEFMNSIGERLARSIDEEMMNSFLDSTNTHLINFSEQLNIQEEG